MCNFLSFFMELSCFYLSFWDVRGKNWKKGSRMNPISLLKIKNENISVNIACLLTCLLDPTFLLMEILIWGDKNFDRLKVYLTRNAHGSFFVTLFRLQRSCMHSKSKLLRVNFECWEKSDLFHLRTTQGSKVMFSTLYFSNWRR